MSKFTTPAILEMLDDYRWRLVEPFEFWLTDNPDDVIYVPEGYVDGPCQCAPASVGTVPAAWSLCESRDYS